MKKILIYVVILLFASVPLHGQIASSYSPAMHATPVETGGMRSTSILRPQMNNSFYTSSNLSYGQFISADTYLSSPAATASAGQSTIRKTPSLPTGTGGLVGVQPLGDASWFLLLLAGCWVWYRRTRPSTETRK